MYSVELIGFVVILTSVLGCTLAVRRLGLICSSLGAAGLRTIETLGAAAAFFGANFAAGLIVIAAMRKLTGQFVSPYILGDASLVGLSLLQGIVFAWWYSASKCSRAACITPSAR